MKGILFTAEMALAACADRKTRTRRVIVTQPLVSTTAINHFRGRIWHANMPDPEIKGLTLHLGEHSCDYVAGERRCLLTTWAVLPRLDKTLPTEIPLLDAQRFFWHAGMGKKPSWVSKSRPGRFLPNHLRSLMPVFEVVRVRAERVNAISEENAKAEGVTLVVGNPRRHDGLDYSSEFASLWDSINARRGFGWSGNPWVWVVEFRRIA